MKDMNRLSTYDSLLRRMRFMSRMHPVLIVPDLILVEPSLHAVG